MALVSDGERYSAGDRTRSSGFRAIPPGDAADLDALTREAPPPDPRRLILWAPVCFGLGVQGYYAAPFEPALSSVGAAVLAAFIATAAVWRTGRQGATLAALAFALVVAGFAAASWRAHRVAAPVLSHGVTAEVSGLVARVDRSAGGSRRLLLEAPEIPGLAPEETPRRVRISLGEKYDFSPSPGDRVQIRARIGPTFAPNYPGGFDFRRWAWSRGIGGVGYALDRGRVAEVFAGKTWRLRLARWRNDIAVALSERMGAASGAFAAAIAVGERGLAPPEALEALRLSSLAHLLAISGLHMGLLTGLIFWLVRAIGAAWPGLSARVPMKKAAAITAILAGLIYLVISGAAVATTRAFIMAAFLFAAVVADRPAAAMRALAMAAMVLLMIWPEELLSPGFQMSFAAATALVAVYEALRGWWSRLREARHRLVFYVAGVALTSLIAGTATAPFALAHFNQAAAYGIPANVAAAPVMAFWVMPWLIATAVLSVFGAEGLGLAALGAGIEAILWIAHTASETEGARIVLADPHPAALWLIVAGGLWACLSERRRWVGAAAILAGALVWPATEPPEVRIAPRGALIGVRNAEGALSVTLPRVNGRVSNVYTATQWLMAEGDGADPETAYSRLSWRRLNGGFEAISAGGLRIAIARRRGAGLAEALCDGRDLVIAPRTSLRFLPLRGGCVALGRSQLAQAVAVYETPGGGLRLVIAETPPRLWTGSDQ